MLNKLLSKKGQIATLTTERAMKMRKGQPTVTKRSTFQCRVGVNYDNIAAVKEKRAEGTLPAENAGLPWGEWLEFPYTIAHKGEVYFRCTAMRNNVPSKTMYFIEGVEIDRDTVQAMCLASEFKESTDNDVFNIKVSSILTVK